MEEVKKILGYKLKKLLGDKATSVTDEDKEFILAQAKSKIQAYCHRSDMPKAIYYIWVDMSIEILKTIDSKLFEKDSMSEEELVKRVTSIKAGDTTIAVGAGNTDDTIDTGYTPTADDDAILNSFAKQLMAFRKFAAGCGCGIDGI